MDDSFRLFVEECDTFQVRTISVWVVRVAVSVNTAGTRVYNFAPTMPPLDPSLTPCSLPSAMNFQNIPPLCLRFYQMPCRGV
jgi:hypothetical protein